MSESVNLNVSVLQPDLRAALETVNRVQRHRLEILGGVRLTASDELALSRTDLELEITHCIPGAVTQPGAIVTPAEPLTKIVRSLPKEARIDLESDGARLTVKCGAFTATLPVLNAGDFPNVSSDGGETVANIESARFCRVLAHVAPAAAKDTTRPVLCGIDTWIDTASDLLAMGAADGFRLTVWDYDKTARAGAGARRYLIPAQSLTAVARLLPREGAVHIGQLGRDRVTLAWDRTQANITLLEGDYPLLEQVIVLLQPVTVTADTRALVDALETLETAADEVADMVRLAVTPGAPLTVRVVHDTLTAEVTVDALIEGDHALEIGINVQYLIEMLRVIDAAQVRIGVSKPELPATLEAVGNAAYRSVVMPMHLPNR